jgi:HEAT repeat protein
MSWQQQWHDTFIILIGLLDDSQAKSFLRWLLRFARASLLAISWGSKTWAANQLFLTVRCLCNTRQAYNELKDSFIELITGRTLYLSATSIPTEPVLFISGDESIYLHFYMLVGQLRTKRTLEFLQQVKAFGRRSKICGLAQFWDMKLLLEEFEEPSRDDSFAGVLAAHFILMFPPGTLIPKLNKFFEEHEVDSKKKLLSAINTNLSYQKGAGGRYKRLGQDDNWFHLLMKLALHDSDSRVREEAFVICRAFGDYEAWLPDICERILLEALKEDEDADVRGRALWYLVYAQSSQSFVALITALDDKELWVVFRALDALRLRDRKNFHVHVVKLLKRFFGSKFGEPETFQLIGESIQSRDDTSEIDAETLEAIQYLVMGALIPNLWVTRSFSVEALFLLRFEFIAIYLAVIFLKDKHENVREKAFLGLTYILHEKAEPSIYQAFEDPSPTVRRAAIISLYAMPDDVGIRALPRLRVLKEEDPDEGVRRDARIIIPRFSEEKSRTGAR